MGNCRELASHGYLVLCVDAHDGTCEYTEWEDGTPVLFENDHDYGDVDTYKLLLERRVENIRRLIDEMCEDEEFAHHQLGLRQGT